MGMTGRVEERHWDEAKLLVGFNRAKWGSRTAVRSELRARAAMAGFTAAVRAFYGSGEVGVEKGGLGSYVGVNGSSLCARCGWRSGELGSLREPWLGGAGMGHGSAAQWRGGASGSGRWVWAQV